MASNDVRTDVSEYYGKDLSGTADLKTSACMTDGEVRKRFPSISAGIIFSEDRPPVNYGSGG